MKADESSVSGGSTGNTDTLEAALSAPSLKVRRHAIIMLGMRKRKDAVPHLVGILSEVDHRTRALVAFALGKIGDRRAVAGLSSALDKSTREDRGWIIRALRDIGDRNAIPAIRKFLSSDDWASRWDAAEALAEFGDVEALSVLRALEREEQVPEDLRSCIPEIISKTLDSDITHDD